ncbi:hypothetical protein [Cohaesibacter marisflavi]|nr:hypothetical protein [Cohaesibacter marisflavi]
MSLSVALAGEPLDAVYEVPVDSPVWEGEPLAGDSLRAVAASHSAGVPHL